MTLTLTNRELEVLIDEINDAVSKVEKEGGQPLKFHLVSIFEKTTTALKPFYKLKEELVKEKGIATENGGFTLQQLKDNTLPSTDDNLTDEFKEYVDLLKQEVDITFKMIPISYLDKLTSDGVYSILPKFVDY